MKYGVETSYLEERYPPADFGYFTPTTVKNDLEFCLKEYESKLEKKGIKEIRFVPSHSITIPFSEFDKLSEEGVLKIWNWVFISELSSDDGTNFFELFRPFICLEGEEIRVRETGAWYDSIHFSEDNIKEILNNDSLVKVYDDTEKTLIAVIYKNHILVPFDFNHFSSERILPYFEALVKRCIETFLEIKKKYSPWYYFEKAVATNLERRRRKIHGEIKELTSELEQIQSSLLSCSVELREVESLIENIEKNTISKIKKDVNKLLKESIVKDVEVEARLSFITNDIICSNENLGSYRIELDFSRPQVRIFHTKLKKGEYPHPHIDTDGLPCFGNIREAVFKFFSEYDVYNLVVLLVSFLSTYRRDDSYIHLDDFLYNLRERTESLAS